VASQPHCRGRSSIANDGPTHLALFDRPVVSGGVVVAVGGVSAPVTQREFASRDLSPLPVTVISGLVIASLSFSQSSGRRRRTSCVPSRWFTSQASRGAFGRLKPKVPTPGINPWITGGPLNWSGFHNTVWPAHSAGNVGLSLKPDFVSRVSEIPQFGVSGSLEPTVRIEDTFPLVFSVGRKGVSRAMSVP